MNILNTCFHSYMQKLTDEAQVISKDDFADYVINHPDEFDFSNFKKIFDVIVSIDQDVKCSNIKSRALHKSA